MGMVGPAHSGNRMQRACIIVGAARGSEEFLITQLGIDGSRHLEAFEGICRRLVVSSVGIVERHREEGTSSGTCGSEQKVPRWQSGEAVCRAVGGFLLAKICARVDQMLLLAFLVRLTLAPSSHSQPFAAIRSHSQPDAILRGGATMVLTWSFLGRRSRKYTAQLCASQRLAS
jgi:hypothetical protein